MSIRISTIVGIVVVLTFAHVGTAELETPAASAKSQSAAEEAVRKAGQDFDDVFNSGNAEKVAALWTADAVYVDEDGRRYRGRDAIKKEYAAFFAANPRAKMHSVIDSVNIVGGTIAIEEGRATLEPPPAGPPATSRYTAVYSLQDGKWLLASVHDLRVANPTNYNRLDDFEWLIGAWQARNGVVRVETQCRWVANKSFIERTYRVVDGGAPISSGIQIIGWDPELQQIRSWTFSSDDGYAQSVWKPHRTGWWAQSSGVLGDGTKTSAVNVLRRIDDATLGWASTDRTAGGLRLPDLPEVTLRRGAERP
jgi:uncharacterized protein (TIGR02246 family)